MKADLKGFTGRSWQGESDRKWGNAVIFWTTAQLSSGKFKSDLKARETQLSLLLDITYTRNHAVIMTH